VKTIFFPGQGTQFPGMGRALFAAYPKLVRVASDLLGYSIEELCLSDPQQRLRLTQYTQPAIYVVNALGYYQWQAQCPSATIDAVAGHSLGELSALLAAGCFDFETGLRIVQKRGQLMSEAGGGGMAAVVGLGAEVLQTLLRNNGLDQIDLANFNSPTQTVIAGDSAAIKTAERLLLAHNVQCIPLNVSAAFHSRHMQRVKQAFADFLKDLTFSDPLIPVVANATARPYPLGQVAQLLAHQIISPVRWTESIRYLMGLGDFDYEEIGADSQRIGGNVLSKLIDEIRRAEEPLHAAAALAPETQWGAPKATPEVNTSLHTPAAATRTANSGDSAWDLTAQQLGNRAFRERYGIKYAYVAGAMYRGTSSVALVIRMGQAGLIGYFGAGGLSLKEIEAAIETVQSELGPHDAYGMNLLAEYADPELELATVQLYLRCGICNIEAAAFMHITRALVLFRVKGLSRDTAGKVHCAHRVLAKVSRLEVAQAFMSPPPAALVDSLRKEGAITDEQAQLSQLVPMSHDICVEADSGGHTDGGIPTILLPAMLQLRQTMITRYHYHEPVCVGLAGGIGTPMAAAAAFIMGADFILTGSINQCTVEAAASDIVKNMLQDASIHDMAYAPAGDLFDIGARVQVLKKGLLFPMRANKLYALYTHYDGLEALPASIKTQLEKNYFKRSLEEVWEDAQRHLQGGGRTQDIVKAQANAKFRMGLIFRWYFGYTTRLAFSGSSDDIANYQVHTGPALGAFNEWVKGTPLAAWPQRHVDQIGIRLLHAAAEHLSSMVDKSHPLEKSQHESVRGLQLPYLRRA
jgi:trans-AT polyketide synthase, acyltransferase and oxidoreductase domains